MNSSDLISRINSRYSSMSKSHKLLATYITDNYDRAVFLTADRLGKTVGVSESTVVRFAAALGYKGYPEFQKALEGMVKEKIEAAQRPEVTYGRIKRAEIPETVLKSDMENIRETLDLLDPDAFSLAADLLEEADEIYVIGLRSCEAPASFLSFYLQLIFPHVHQIRTTSVSEIFEQLFRISEKDVIFGISFPRYSLRTLKALEFANSRSAKVITLTDSSHSPLNLYSSCNLIAASGMASIVDSLTAPFSVINALIVALCMKRQDVIAANLDILEEIRDDYLVFENDEINPVDDHLKMHYAENPSAEDTDTGKGR